VRLQHLWKGLRSDDPSGDDDNQRAGNWQQARNRTAGEVHVDEESAGVDKEQTEADEDGGESSAERDDQQQAEEEAVRGDGDEEHHQRLRARQEPARDAEGEEAAPTHPVCWVVAVAMSVVVVVAVVVSGRVRRRMWSYRSDVRPILYLRKI